MIEFEPLDGPFGRAMHGLNISDNVDADTCRQLGAALYEHRVPVLKNQTCDEAAFLAFGRQWGAPIPHVLDNHRLPGFPKLLQIGNIYERAKDRLIRNNAAFWHTDQPHAANPATATIL